MLRHWWSFDFTMQPYTSGLSSDLSIAQYMSKLTYIQMTHNKFYYEFETTYPEIHLDQIDALIVCNTLWKSSSMYLVSVTRENR